MLVHDAPAGRLAARIVETEAYGPGDRSSHAFAGKTSRNASMFLARGCAYVYFIYGTSYCLNVASERAGVGAAVLIRAAEPLSGLAEMRRKRGALPERDLLRGPGRLCAAFGLDRGHDGLDLCAPGALWLAASPAPPRALGASVRIGLSTEAHRVMRFYEAGSAHLSGPRRLGS